MKAGLVNIKLVGKNHRWKKTVDLLLSREVQDRFAGDLDRRNCFFESVGALPAGDPESLRSAVEALWAAAQ